MHILQKNLYAMRVKVLFLLGFTFFLHTLGLAQNETIDRISYPKEIIKLGPVQEGEIVKFSFTLKNISKQAVEITQIHPSCGCTTTEMEAFVLKAKKSKKIPMSFNSDGRPGTNYKEIHILSSEGMFVVKFEVEVMPKTH
jgi:hypothetical protein